MKDKRTYIKRTTTECEPITTGEVNLGINVLMNELFKNQRSKFSRMTELLNLLSF